MSLSDWLVVIGCILIVIGAGLAISWVAAIIILGIILVVAGLAAASREAL